MQEQNQKMRQSPDIGNSVPDIESQTISSTHLKTAAAASNKSASIFSKDQNAEQSHETHIINSLQEQLMQLGLSKNEIEMEYEKYLPIAARAITEKSEIQAELLQFLCQRFLNNWATAAAKTSNQDDVTLEQEPINNGGNHSIDSSSTQIESIPCPDENFYTLAADPDLDSQTAFSPTLTEVEDIESIPRSYVAEVVTESTQIQINDALAYVAAHGWIPRLHESINDIAAAFCKLARVLDINCSGNDDFYLILFEIWQKLYQK
ncbi:MAG: hypothetical protein II388_02600 [Clostridia bacterium]|nr:hypothetical protein [Clostridia bacterium]